MKLNLLTKGQLRRLHADKFRSMQPEKPTTSTGESPDFNRVTINVPGFCPCKEQRPLERIRLKSWPSDEELAEVFKLSGATVREAVLPDGSIVQRKE